MIDNNNQYAEYSNKDLRDKWDASSWQWLWDNDIRPTLESLRNVAQAAQKIYDVEGDYVGDCTCTSCKKINEGLEGALAALPDWVLEDE